MNSEGFKGSFYIYIILMINIYIFLCTTMNWWNKYTQFSRKKIQKYSWPKHDYFYPSAHIKHSFLTKVFSEFLEFHAENMYLPAYFRLVLGYKDSDFCACGRSGVYWGGESKKWFMNCLHMIIFRGREGPSRCQ